MDSEPSLWITRSATLWITLWTEPVDRLRDLWTTEGDLWTVGRAEGVEVERVEQGRGWPRGSRSRVSRVADHQGFGRLASITERSRGEW